MQKIAILFALMLANPSIRAQVSADCWTGYRGNLDNGYSLAQNVPTHWNDSTNIAWKVLIPGRVHGIDGGVGWGDIFAHEKPIV